MVVFFANNNIAPYLPDPTTAVPPPTSVGYGTVWVRSMFMINKVVIYIRRRISSISYQHFHHWGQTQTDNNVTKRLKGLRICRCFHNITIFNRLTPPPNWENPTYLIPITINILLSINYHWGKFIFAHLIRDTGYSSLIIEYVRVKK